MLNISIETIEQLDPVTMNIVRHICTQQLVNITGIIDHLDAGNELSDRYKEILIRDVKKLRENILELHKLANG